MSLIQHLPHRLWLLALVTVLLALFATGLGTSQAQLDPENAVIQDLAERSDVDASEVDVTRLDAATWNDACLGAAEADELCAQVLTDGWVIWISDGSGVFRYHTNLDGSALRLAASGLTLDEASSAKLPEGAVGRPTERPEPFEEEPDGPILVLEPGVGTVSEFLAGLEATGVPAALREIALTRAEIPVSSAGQIGADGTTIEVYDLGSAAAGEMLLNALRSEGSVLSANVTYWVAGQIAVVLTEAPSHLDLQDTISSIVGPPALLTIATLPPPSTDTSGGDGELVPEVLPSTGTGGVGDRSSGISAWLWVAISGGFTLLVAVGLMAAGSRLSRRPR